MPLAVAPVHADGLVFLGRQRDGVGGIDGLDGVNSVAVSPDGAHVYVASFNDNAVAVFQRAPATGALAFVQVQRHGVGGVTGLDGASSVVVSPDGAHVYVASNLSDALAVFQRAPATGALAFVGAQHQGAGGVDGLGGATSVAVSPDGAHVYVASIGGDAVAVFRRATGGLGASGNLTFVQARKDGVAGVDGLDGARSVAVSPEGAHVYVASVSDDAVAVFKRDAAAGTLAFVQVHKNVAALVGAGETRSLSISPDGAHVYVAASGDDDGGVAVFRRDAASGALTFVEAERDGVGGVDGLVGASAVAVSPDGAQVYVASYFGNALAVFQRDAASGTLAFVEARKDGVAGVDGLGGAISVAVSPDGAQVYVGSNFDDSVAAFRQITCGDGYLDAGEQCEDGNQRTGDCCSATCQLEPPGSGCTDEGNACTADTCDAGGTCNHLPTPGIACADDGNGCTADVCASDGACSHPATPGVACAPDDSICTADVCDATGSCGHIAAPAAGCFGATARGGRLELADRRGARDRLAWRWRGTTPGGAAAFGDPLGSTAYALCVYRNDPTGGAELALDASVPPGGRCGRRACWKRARGGFAYRDRKGRHAGVRALRLAAGRITVAGRGAQLGLPALPFGDDREVRAQLRRADGGACWETSFSRAQRRSKRVFRARTD